MSHPRIEFIEQANGRVAMRFVAVGPSLNEANSAAFALAKRGLTKHDLNKHPKWPGSFEFSVSEEKKRR